MIDHLVVNVRKWLAISVAPIALTSGRARESCDSCEHCSNLPALQRPYRRARYVYAPVNNTRHRLLESHDCIIGRRLEDTVLVDEGEVITPSPIVQQQLDVGHIVLVVRG